MGLTLPADRYGFKDAHKGETVWVIGSGSSLDYIPREFFADKTCVCVNLVGTTLQLDRFYTVSHYHADAIEVATMRPDLPVIVPENDLGSYLAAAPATEPNIYHFPTGPQLFGAFDPLRDWPTDPEQLVVGPTSLHMTMHFAAYLGAAHIVIVGADCGTLDDRSNFAGYSIGDNPFQVWQRVLGMVADQIRASGTSVHSLNPFVNFALEGHKFQGPTVTIN